eukprot:540088-Pyramimonas_sp.AAC.1
MKEDLVCIYGQEPARAWRRCVLCALLMAHNYCALLLCRSSRQRAPAYGHSSERYSASVAVW